MKNKTMVMKVGAVTALLALSVLGLLMIKGKERTRTQEVPVLVESVFPKMEVAFATVTAPKVEVALQCQQPTPSVTAATDKGDNSNSKYEKYLPDSLLGLKEVILPAIAKIDGLGPKSDPLVAVERDLNKVEEASKGPDFWRVYEEISQSMQTNADASISEMDNLSKELKKIHEELKVALGDKYPEFYLWDGVRSIAPPLENFGLESSQVKDILALLMEMREQGNKDERKILASLSSVSPDGQKVFNTFRPVFSSIIDPKIR